MATEYAKIKQAVELQKTKKATGEARLVSLSEEETRIYADIERETGKKVTSKEELEVMNEQSQKDIADKIRKMKEILDAEGVAY
jgi:ABC-type Zn uptake system ZnuABC Zn-binding protein ZnuA